MVFVADAAATYDGGPCEFLLSDEWFTVPFGASAYQDPQATRLTMEIDVTTSSVLPHLQALDQWAMRYVADRGVLDDMSAEDVARTYKPCLQTSERYNTIRLRTKLNSTGNLSCQFFLHPDNTPTTFDKLDLRTSNIRPVIRLKGIWRQAGQWGLQLEVRKLLVDPQASGTWDF